MPTKTTGNLLKIIPLSTTWLRAEFKPHLQFSPEENAELMYKSTGLYQAGSYWNSGRKKEATKARSRDKLIIRPLLASIELNKTDSDCK